MLLTSQSAVEFNPNNAILLMPQRLEQHCAFLSNCSAIMSCFPAVERGYLTLVVLILLPA